MSVINQLTIGEIAKVEELSGASIQAFSDDKAPKALVLAALAFVTKRREDPAFTWNEAQGMTLDQVNEIVGFADEGEDADPLETLSPSPKKAAASKRNAAKPKA